MQIKQLYNLFAGILRIIVSHMSERDFERMRNIDKDHENRILESLKAKFPALFDSTTGNTAELSEYRLEESTLIQDLELEMVNYESVQELVFLARSLDSFLEDSFYHCIPIEADWYGFFGLNDNAEECGIYLLPWVKCSWEHKSRDVHTSYSIFYYLRNFYFVRREDLGDYAVQHILMPKRLFYPALKRREFRVAVSPGTNKEVVKVTEPYVRDDVRYVSVKPMEGGIEKGISEIVLKVLKKASEQEADVLMLPEMLGTEQILKALQEELFARKMIPDNEYPRLIVCPTIWENRKNSCTVFDDMGERIFEQCKHHGVDMKQIQAKEDIESDRMIYILHCFGIGRIAVAICKDFLMVSYLRILAECLRVNLLLVPSFTSVDHHFMMLSRKYAELDWSVIWVNACASRWLNADGKAAARIFMAYMAGRKGIITEEKSVDDLCGKREHCDQGCTYIYRIDLGEEMRK